MNKLEEQHLKEIRDVLHNKDNKTLAKSCAAITKDVAVKFAEWKQEALYPTRLLFSPTPDLFDYFIENVYGK